jgi:TRAP-type C4-dicarboxylate transport system permease small subunit
MKNIPFIYIAITTLAIITITIASAMNLPFNWIFYLSLVGQALVVLMVYKVLTDKYRTNKNFEDFYGDHSIKNVEFALENAANKNENFR